MARHGEKATESHRAVDRASCLRTHRVGVYRRSSRPLTQCTSSLVPASPSLGCAHPRSKRGPTSFAYFVVRRRRGRDLIGPLIAGCLFVNEGTEGDGGVVDHFIAIRLGPRSRGQCEQRVAQLPALRIHGDVGHHFGCATNKIVAYDLGAKESVPLTCTGPEGDLLADVSSDDWPAFTTKGSPVAGHGVDAKLLGTVLRPGIGKQITYAGHPLYLFDPRHNRSFPKVRISWRP